MVELSKVYCGQPGKRRTDRQSAVEAALITNQRMKDRLLITGAKTNTDKSKSLLHTIYKNQL